MRFGVFPSPVKDYYGSAQATHLAGKHVHVVGLPGPALPDYDAAPRQLVWVESELLAPAIGLGYDRADSERLRGTLHAFETSCYLSEAARTNSPLSTSSILHSGQTGFLNQRPTLSGQQSRQNSLRQVGHCQRVGLPRPPTLVLHLEQKPRTIAIRSRNRI